MEIRYTRSTGESYSNAKIQKKTFTNHKEKMRYLINFLNEKANAKTTKDNPSHLKNARFMFLKPTNNFFDTIEFTLGGTPQEVDELITLVYG